MRESDLNDYYQAYEHFFPEGVVYQNDTPFLRWENKEDFVKDIKDKTGIDTSSGDPKLIEESQLILAKLTPPEATTPGKEQLKTLKAEAQKRTEAQKTAAEEGKRQTREYIKNVYAKLESQPKPELSKKEQEAIDAIKQAAKADPQGFTQELANEIETKITPLKEQGLSDEEIKILSKQTAATITQNLQQIDSPDYTPVSVQVAILSSLAQNEKIAGEDSSKVAENLAVYKGVPDRITRKITENTLGDKFTQIIFGPSPDRIKVTLSQTPQEGFNYQIDLAQLKQGSQQLTKKQNFFLEQAKQVKGLGIGQVGQARSFVLRQAGSAIEKRIAAIPAQSVAGKFLSSVEAKSLLFTTFGVGEPVAWETTNWLAGLVIKISPQTAPFLSGLGKLIGVDLVRAAAPTAAVVTEGATEGVAITTGVIKAGEAAGAAIGVATKKGISAVISKAITALGAASSWATAGLSLVAGWLIGKTIEKIPWDKVKKAIPYVVGAATFIIWGPIVGVATGVGSYALITGLSGATMAGVGLGFGRFFRGLGKAFAITIGAPVIVTITALPIVVALILFIINSGAYIVPPSPYSEMQGYDNPYISVTKKANSNKISNPSGKITVTYTVKVTALKTILTNLKISGKSCKVTKKNKSQVKCPIENIPNIPSGLTVSPSAPYSFTFSTDFDSSFSDSFVFDSIEVTADSPEQKNITSSGSETVCVGDCPNNCIKVVDNADTWPENQRSNTENAALELQAGYPSFMARVCSAGEVNLCYKPSVVSSGGWHVHHTNGDKCDIYFKGTVLSNEPNSLFMLAHELSHHIQTIDGGASISEYLQFGAPNELPICSYPINGAEKTSEEGMAEANGLYVSIPSWGGCVGNFKSKYPLNYNFAKGFMQ